VSSNGQIAGAFLCSIQCVENVRKKLVTEGFDIPCMIKNVLRYAPFPPAAIEETAILAFYENQRFCEESTENTEFYPILLSERPRR